MGHRPGGVAVPLAAIAALAAGLLPVGHAGAGPAPAPGVPGDKDPRGRYVVVLHDDVPRPEEIAAEHERRYGAEVSHVYDHALKGYAARLPEQALSGISHDPRVTLVEADQQVEASVQVTPTGVQRIFAPSNSAIDIDGVDDVRIDVDVAIIDTGIDLDHPDLNVAESVDCTATSSVKVCLDGLGDDDNGHGSHVAGTVAAIDNEFGVVGVAPGARLHAVKVLSAVGSGLMSWVIAGVDWVTARADTIEVANMSLGCWCSSSALNDALAASVDRGVVYAVAAGNDGEDAKEFAPASHPDVITVSALADFDGKAGGEGAATCRPDNDDTLADFSNWGSTVEVAAPGVCIRSTYALGLYATLSGTSMASPHVTGAAALLAAGANDPQNETDVFAIRQTIIDHGNFDWLDDSGDGIMEPLLDVGDSLVFGGETSSGSEEGGTGAGSGGDDSGTESGMTLAATGYKVKGVQHADLEWGGSDASGNVIVHRDGVAVATTHDDGAYTDNIGRRGGGSYVYKLCEEDTMNCSNEVTVTY